MINYSNHWDIIGYMKGALFSDKARSIHIVFMSKALTLAGAGYAPPHQQGPGICACHRLSPAMMMRIHHSWISARIRSSIWIQLHLPLFLVPKSCRTWHSQLDRKLSVLHGCRENSRSETSWCWSRPQSIQQNIPCDSSQHNELHKHHDQPAGMNGCTVEDSKRKLQKSVDQLG